MKKASFALAPVVLVTLALVFPINLPFNTSSGDEQASLKASQINRVKPNSQISPNTNSDVPVKTSPEPSAKTDSKSQTGIQPQPGSNFRPAASTGKTANTGSVTKIVPVQAAAPSTKPALSFKPPVGHKKEIVGYYAEDWPGDYASLNSVKKYGNKLSGIATFSFKLNYNGTLTGNNPSTAIKISHSTGGKALVLVHNYNNGKFDSGLVHTVISDAARRKKAAANILSVITKGNFDGVNIDLENIPSADKALFTRFIRELADVLHGKGYTVTVSVPAKTSDASGGWGGAFDYSELGKAADRIMLMTYDEHWFGGIPGPVASIGWVEQVIGYAKSRIPAHKLLLGLGIYGYEWDVDAGSGMRALPPSKALQVAYQYKADIQWDKTSQMPYFYYWPNGRKHVVWFESNNSAAFKMDLVNRHNLAGVAIWRLGFEDAAFWQLVSQKFGAVN